MKTTERKISMSSFRRFMPPELADMMSLFKDIFLDEEYIFRPENESPRIIDCGANIGFSIEWFIKKWPKATIIAFEPSPNSFNKLKKRLQPPKFSNVSLVNAALAAENGNIIFWQNDTKSLIASGRIKPEGQQAQESKVQAVKLSGYIGDIPVDLLKMDIEGMEDEVLSELHDSGKLGLVKQIILEYHGNTGHKNDLDHIVKILTENDFDAEIEQKRFFTRKRATIENIDKTGKYLLIIRASRKKI